MHKKKAGKLQTGSTFPKQYWLAVNGKPKTEASETAISGIVDGNVPIAPLRSNVCTLTSSIATDLPTENTDVCTNLARRSKYHG